MNNFKHLYQKSLNHLENELHFVAHSHHLWPDSSFKGQIQYWEDSIRLNDEKWNYLFETKLPEVQKLIANLISLPDHRRIVLAPNTHEFILRILSLFEPKKNLRILSTDSEFYSFQRQVDRLCEDGLELKQISTSLLLTNREEFFSTLVKELQTSQYDIFFISQVFFNSGLALTQKEIEKLVLNTPEETLFILDGYHGFAAIPLDLTHLYKRIFYLGGGYKYAQAGEGMGFMVVPEGDWRPRNTGWFSEIFHLSEKKSKEVNYGEGAGAFWGATQDPSSWYRFSAIWNEFTTHKITLSLIHQHVQELQAFFIKNQRLTSKIAGRLLGKDFAHHGHFLTYEFKDSHQAQQIKTDLLNKKIKIDQLNNRLRIGFGLYQTKEDVEDFFQRLN